MSNERKRDAAKEDQIKDEADIDRKSVWIKDALKLIVERERQAGNKRSGNQFLADLATLTAALLSHAVDKLPPNVTKEQIVQAYLLDFTARFEQIERLKEDR